jgi:hypothetical protein
VTDADRPMHVRAAAPEPTTGDVDNPAHPDSPSASVPHRGASHREAGFSHADPPELGVAVGVLDTGIAANGDLAGRVVASADLSGEWSFDDAYGHGTFMAGLVAGGDQGDGPAGVAPAPAWSTSRWPGPTARPPSARCWRPCSSPTPPATAGISKSSTSRWALRPMTRPPRPSPRRADPLCRSS